MVSSFFTNRVRKALIALQVCIPAFCSVALAGNEHEHLQYLVRFEDVEKAAGGQLGKFPAHDFTNDYFNFIYQRYGEAALGRMLPKEVLLKTNDKLNVEAIKKYLNTSLQDKNFTELCERLSQAEGKGRSARDTMKMFFDASASDVGQMNAYLAATEARGQFFHEHPDLFVDSVRNYVGSVKKKETLKTLFSVPDFLAEPEILASVKKIYSDRGAQVQFYYSVPRRRLEQANFDFSDKLKSLNEMTEKHLIDGIDISGSVREGFDKKTSNELYLLYHQRLKQLFSYSRKNGAPLRIHAFEAGRTGQFYQALHTALTECKSEGCLPAVLRFGHIQELSAEDLIYLAQFKEKMPIVFEANIESNLRVQSAELKSLAAKIEQIHQSDFRVVLGSDGAGILGESSSFENTLLSLKSAGMDPHSVERLIRDAYLPITNTRIPKTELLKWQVNRDKIRARVLGDAYAPAARKGCTGKEFCKFLKQLIVRRELAL